jgi:hypothetical protein
MKPVKIMTVVAALLIAASAYCESLGIIPLSARQLGMGGAAIAVADDAFAWAQNPAGVASLANKPKEDGKWAWDAAASYAQSNEISGDRLKAWDVSLSACDPADGMGFGAGWAQPKISDEKMNLYGAGFGMRVKAEGWNQLSWGVSVQRINWPSGADLSDDTIFNIGLMYDVPIPDRKPIKLGLVVNDVTDKLGDLVEGEDIYSSLIGRTWSMGTSFEISPRLLFAADMRGFGNAGRTWSTGVEYKCDEWAFRAGDLDGGLTLGVGYKGSNWFIDYAHGTTPKLLSLVTDTSVKVNAVTVGVNF